MHILIKIIIGHIGSVLLCLGGRSHEAYSNCACVSVCLSALVLKDGEESAGGKCNIDITR